MNDCRRTVERMTPYVDGELPPAECAGIDAHLDECPACRRAFDEAGSGRHLLRRLAPRLEGPPLPPGLRSRCEAVARAQHARGGMHGWVGRLMPAFAVAVLVLVTALAVFALATRRSNVVLVQQLTMDHMKCFRLFAPHDSAGQDAHTVEAMLAARYGWHLSVPPGSSAAGLTLLGARRCLYASGTIPHVMYRMGNEEVSLFVLDGQQREEADLHALGHRSKIWSDGEDTFVLVSAAGGDTLERAAHYIREQESHR